MEITAYFFWALHDEAMRVLHDEATTQQVGAALEMLSWLRASSSQVLGRVLDIGAQGWAGTGSVHSPSRACILPPLKAFCNASKNGNNVAESSWLTVLVLSLSLVRWCDPL